MHETANFSAVTDALVKFALAPVGERGERSLSAARATMERARLLDAPQNENYSSSLALLAAQQGSSNDPRVNAWALAATLATGGESGFSPPVVAAAIVAGKIASASDALVAEAVAIGVEVSTRVLAALDSAEFRERWNVTSAVGVLGAVLAVCRVFDVREGQARHALGIAATQAAGLAHNNGNAVGALEIGKASADAIEAALLAKHGFTSAAASIDGRRGLAALMAYRFDDAFIRVADDMSWLSEA